MARNFDIDTIDEIVLKENDLIDYMIQILIRCNNKEFTLLFIGFFG